MRQVQKALALARPLSAKAAPRPDSGPANSPADGLCPLRPPKANQLRMAAKERLQT